MVFTLQRYIFRELLRIFILATIGLTLILSLGAILRPVQEYGVGPRQVVHILIYFMPITLTFVLPMAALFASALAYGRFAGDNEVDACRASGISMLTLIYPGLALAVLVAIANLLLSFHVMPYFVHLAEKLLKADAKQILFRNIDRRGYYGIRSSRYQIYADHPDLKTDTLYGIVVVEASDEGIRRVVTSDETRVQFDPCDNVVHLTTFNARQMGAAANDMSGKVGEASFMVPFGSLLGDDIKFKKIEEMKRIRADLLRFGPIAELAHNVHTQLVTELLARDLRERMAATPDGSYELVGPSLHVRLSGARWELRERATITLTPAVANEPVRVEERNERTGTVRRLICEKVEIGVKEDAARPHVSLRLQNPRVQETGQLVVQHALGPLAVPERVGHRLGEQPLLHVAMSDASGLLGGPSSAVLDKQQKELVRKVARTLTDIKAEVNSRLVFGIGCVPMILIGIGLGILQRGGHLLSAFGASCLPAAVLIVTIISGKNITKNLGVQNSSGVVIMWAGLAFLLLLTAFIYGKLRRS